MRQKIYTLAVLLTLTITAFGQTPAWQWAKSAGGYLFEFSNDISTDAFGNVYVTGCYVSPTMAFDTTYLTNTAAGTYDIFVSKYNSSGNLLWAKRAGGINDDKGNCISTDAFGNVYVAGYFNSPTIVFGSTILTNADSGSLDIFLVKYDSSGNVLWARSGNGTSDDYSGDISTDLNGNVYLIGTFVSSAIIFSNDTLTNSGSPFTGDICIVKYDSSGNVIWAKSAAGPNYDVGNAICTDTRGNMYATGNFSGGSISFDSITIYNPYADIFIAKYDSSGNLLWVQGDGGDDSKSISTDTSGNIYITGHFSRPAVIFGNDTLTNASAPSPDYNPDVFIAKFNASGNALWAKPAGGTDYDFSNGISSDVNGNSYIVGYYQSSTISFGNTTLTNTGGICPVGGCPDIFVAKYDSSGNALWALSAGGTDYDGIPTISRTPGGAVYITGFFRSPTITFGSTILYSAGYEDIFVAKLDNITGIPEHESLLPSINIYPNPGNGSITIVSSENMKEIKVINLVGQLMYHSLLDKNIFTLELSGEGSYFIQVTTNTGSNTNKLIVLRK